MKFISQPAQNQHFNSDNVEDLMMFRKAFDFENLDREKVQQDLKKVLESAEDKNTENLIKLQTVFTFKAIMAYYKPEVAPGWNTKMVFHVDNVGSFCVAVKNGKAEYTEDISNPTCNVYTDIGTLATQLCIIRLEDTREDDELTDSDLEMVAGGKGGGCGAESSVSSACGADYSGAGACGGAACGAAGCGAAACGGDACGAAGCAGAACGEAACGGAACGGDVCGGAGCGGAACGAAACGGAACGADACGGAVCGVAVGVGACAGNACGVDVQGVADVGPCGINICPGIPGI